MWGFKEPSTLAAPLWISQGPLLRCLHSVLQNLPVLLHFLLSEIRHLSTTPNSPNFWYLTQEYTRTLLKTKSTLSFKRRRKFCSLCGDGQAHTLALKRLEVIKCFLMECRRLSKLVQRKCFSSQSILNSVPMFFPLALKHSSEIALLCRNFCPREHLHAICQWCLLALKCVPETLFLCKPGGLGH